MTDVSEPTSYDEQLQLGLDAAWAWVEDLGLAGAGTAQTLDVEDPSSGTILTRLPVTTERAVERAIRRAGDAQATWERTSMAERRSVLAELGEVVSAHRAELAAIDAIDSGNPLQAMYADIGRAGHHFTTWCSAAMMTGGQTIPVDDTSLHLWENVPYGTVGRITAFNHPGYFAIKAVIPPLVMGNAVVLKPADQTPLSALRIAELFAEHAPEGLLSVLPGKGETGRAIVRHPDVKRVGFTGSEATGRRIQQDAAAVGVKHVTLELGGKNALIALPDSDPERVAEAAVRGMNLTSCQGQSCGSTSRIFLHEQVHDAVVKAIRTRLEGIRLGRAYDPDTMMGPLISADHRDRVADYVRSGLEDGAELVAGGAEPPAGMTAGHYLRPSLFVGVDPGMRIAQDEVFGPLVSVLSWSREDELLAAANATPYGLTASVWGQDIDRLMRIARALRVGYVWINDVATHYFGTPFGGFKNSGIGREECLEELFSYAEPRSMHIRYPAESS